MRVIAPGKLVLAGEYAVLDGAPALVCAVDRGVSCTVEPDPTLRWSTPGDDRFVAAALLAAQAPPGHYRFAAHNPVPAHTKVGFGHSAAATVAAVVAAGAQGGYDLARRVHHEVQGSGSGIDVAASWFGGVLRFHEGQASAATAIEPLVVWSGDSAATGPRVQQYQAWPDRQAFTAESTRLVDAFDTAPLDVLRACRRLLTDMAQRAGVAYWTPALSRICDLAEAHGGAAKPSGAGGGDCVICLFDDELAERAFVSAVHDAGYMPIDVNLAPGVSP